MSEQLEASGNASRAFLSLISKGAAYLSSALDLCLGSLIETSHT
ncbi:hypothetical protein Patl1_37439 [Pistacia atlantica]|nr:hypothetical protein Patl1_37439 [Pistacia atlantica]